MLALLTAARALAVPTPTKGGTTPSGPVTPEASEDSFFEPPPGYNETEEIEKNDGIKDPDST